LTSFQVREIDIKAMTYQNKVVGSNVSKPVKNMMDKAAEATFKLFKEQVAKDNKFELELQQILLHHVPSMIFEVLTKVSGDKYTFMI